jgi:hypothetical protein
LPDKARALLDRFKKLNVMTKRRTVVADEPVQRTPQQLRDDELNMWAQDPVCENSFLPYLQERMEELENLMINSVESPSKLAAQTGAREELRQLKRKFEQFLEGD